MNYLQEIDLQTQAFQVFFDKDNSTDKAAILTNIENQNIALIKSKLNGRYDVEAIFNATGADRHWLMIKILSKLVTYDFFRRNAARKIPSDLQEEYEWAMKILEDINAGKETPAGLPIYTDDDGNTQPIYGNSKNKNFYI